MCGVDSSVFKSYDVRGTYADQLDERFAYLLGRALPEVLPAARVAVGYDARLSSPSLCAALTAGLQVAGAKVIGLGLCLTELVYYALGADQGFDLGVMITASHNPPEYNGFKLVKAGGELVLGRNGLDAVRERMQDSAAGTFPGGTAPTETVDLLDEYVDFALDLVGTPEVRGLQVVVDAGNGVGGLLWDALSPRVGLEPLRINCEPDGRFPAHDPDPSRRENLEPLVQRVLAVGAALGLCYDGDADRVVVVLADGHVVDGSEMTACLAGPLLDRNPSLVFGVGQTTSRKALDHFRSRGAEPVMLPVGHGKIKRVMRATAEMEFAGEDAGHYYYRDFYCCDSSLITTLRMLRLAADGKLDGMVNSLPGPWHRPVSEPSFGFADPGRALAVCREVACATLDHHPDWLEITSENRGRILRDCERDDIWESDGARADYTDWWFCVRPSGTEPIARLALEARSRGLLQERTAELSALFEDNL